MDSKKRWRPRFGLILLAYALLLMIVASFILNSLWDSMESYERSSPSYSVSAFFDTIRDGDFEAVFEQGNYEVSALNSKDSYLAYFRELFDGDLETLSSAEIASSELGIKKYHVYLGEKQLCKITLTEQPENAEMPWKASIVCDAKHSCTVTAAQETTPLVNGVDISTLGLEPENVTAQYYVGNKTENDPLLPTILRYQVDGLLMPPTVSGKYGETACDVVKDGEEDNKYLLYLPISEENQAQMNALVEKIAQTYCRFVTRDATKNSVLNLLYKDTVFYDGIKSFYNGWYAQHDYHGFENQKLSGLHRFSEKDFTGDISFTYVIKWGRKTRTYPTENTATFIKVNDQWKVLHFRFNSETDLNDSDWRW